VISTPRPHVVTLTAAGMAGAREKRCSRAAVLVLAVAAVTLSAAPAAAQNSTAGGVTTGRSALSIAAFPLSSAYK
jgi:hypothetical protein